MKAYIKIIILAGILLTGCNENYLDKYPQTSISPEAFFNTEEDLSLYINGLLQLPTHSSYLSDQSTDNAATTAAVEIKTMMTGNPSSQVITSGWDWSRLRHINYFLDNYQKANVSAEVKNHYLGMARYYRAAFYFNMVKRYSDVPWYSQTLASDDQDLFKTQDPRTLVMDSVMADLDFAGMHVRESVPTGTPGKWAVKTLQARVALYEGSYRKYHSELNLANTADAFLQKAVTVAREIMDSGNFQIYNTGNPDADYLTLFNSPDLLNNREVILANIYDSDRNRRNNVNSVVFGDYEQAPSRDLVHTYLMRDGKRFTDQKDYQKFEFVREFKNRDPRLSQTLVYPGWIRVPETKPYIQRMNKNFTGYHQLKGFVNTTDDKILNSNDFPVYRYAEILLILAEAKAEQGTLTQADLNISVNLLRKRAGLPDLLLSEANATPDPFMEDKYKNVSGPYKGVLLEIRRERRVEFAFENMRYDDLMRWHAGKILTNIPQGMYFSGLGNYDMTGDNIPDIKLISKNTPIPAEAAKEKNELGEVLIYYRAGSIGDDVTVYLENGENGGTMVTETAVRNFIEPKYYYRPVPYTQMVLNPNLKQLFGWE